MTWLLNASAGQLKPIGRNPPRHAAVERIVGDVPPTDMEARS